MNIKEELDKGDKFKFPGESGIKNRPADEELPF